MGRREVNGPRIVYLDVETAPLEVYTWGTFKQNIANNQIKTPWGLLSAAWLWEGERKVQYADNRAAENGPRDDRALMQRLWTVLDAADIVITQNGIDFDIRRINARFIELGMLPPSPFKQIDTKVIAKKVGWFVSNKLEWLGDKVAHHPKDKHRKFPGFELWLEVLGNNPAAWKEMEKYNKEDVRVLRDLYKQLVPWVGNHPNLGLYHSREEVVCPKCGSEHVHARGYAHTTTGKYQRFHCQACGGWSRGATVLNTKAKRQNLLRGV